jgi:hypothetical protein
MSGTGEADAPVLEYSITEPNHLGVICGLGFGLLDAALTLPMSFPDKRAGILGAFTDSDLRR